MITLAIQNIRPNSDWYLEGETYDKLVWLDKKTQKPTEEEINAEIHRIKQIAQQTEYQTLRAKEYPPIEVFVDAWVKNDQQALEDYRQKCLAVKAKYPKS